MINSVVRSTVVSLVNPLALCIVLFIAVFVWWPISATAQVDDSARHEQGLAVATAGSQKTPRRVRDLIRNGAVDLAARIINESQPSYNNDAATWVEWEYIRLQLYRHRQQVNEVRQRIAQLPDSLPRSQRLALLTIATEVEQRTGNVTRARAQLRQMLWRYQADDKQRAAWRRSIIHAYVAEGRFTDARLAAQQFEKEYKPTSRAWKLLYARVHILAGESAEALRRLAGMGSTVAETLRLLAQLRSQSQPAAEVARLAAALAIKEEKKENRDITVARDAWLVAAEAAGVVRDDAQHVRALEHAHLLHDEKLPQPFSPRHFTMLLELYNKVAEQSTAQLNLANNDERAWLDAAAALHKAGEQVRARAILITLAGRASQPQIRYAVHRKLLESWDTLNLPGLYRIVHRLYYGAQPIGAPREIPAAIRFKLARRALAAGHNNMTADFLRELSMPADVEDALEWRMHHARMTIYAGRFIAGAKLMEKLIREWRNTSDDGGVSQKGKRAERFASAVEQIVFDLQAVREHKLALRLLKEMLPRAHTLEFKRRLLYWSGESESSLNNHELAAYLYLQSALLSKGDGYDLLGKPARLKAAMALAEAGLIEDARRVYEGLLNHASSAREHAVIEEHIENLYLSTLRPR